MKNFGDFMKNNRTMLYAAAEKNTRRNAEGHAVITRDDPWFDENEWDEHYKELNANEKNLPARSLVR